MTTQRDGQNEVQAQLQPSWPLSATLEAHAHLTWAEWTAQEASVALTKRQEPAFPATNQRSLVARLDRSLDRSTAERLTWPLPATLLPNARLAWAASLDAQSRQLVAMPEEIAEVAMVDESAA